MPLDALCLAAAAGELRGFLVGCRVDKVQQPERDVVLLSVRGPAGAGRLLLSAGVGSARVHLTSQSRENPQEPPMFCMLLRKHLTGARITGLEQPGMERLYLLSFACLDELGVASEKKLAVEMMGRSANLILIDSAGRILDCLRKADAEQSPKRQVLPGLFYELPPKQDKPSIFHITEDELTTLYDAADGTKPGDAWLVSALAGVSPLLARELVCRVSGATDTPLRELTPEALLRQLAALRDGDHQPRMLLEGDKPLDLYCLPLRQYGNTVTQTVYPSFSALLDGFYTERERRERQSQRGQALTKLVKNRRERAARKLGLRVAERKATEQRETWRQYGDLLKANLYRMQRGATTLRTENFYAEDGGEIVIPLDPKLSPQQNAAHYYKQYAKAKHAEKVLTGQIEEAQNELNYLESVLEELTLASGEKDLAEIRQELIGEGYLKESGGRKKKASTPQPLRFRSGSGALILVGRNNVQNDWLTLKAADKGHLWFHAQRTHGAHVVAQCDGNDQETMRTAALLAAWYSKGRESSNVAVDYTRVKNVKKPAGAKPGMVIYTDYKTLYVTPERAAIEAICPA